MKRNTALLRARKRLTLDEAAYLVIEAVNGRWDEAVHLLAESIVDGVLSADVVPTVDPHSGTIIAPIDPTKTMIATADLIAWLAILKQKSHANNQSGVFPIASAGKLTIPEWITRARDIGTVWMLAQEKGTGKRPTVVQIAEHLEGELSTQGIKGARGKFLDRETIKREALTGITGRVKGDNFKNAKRKSHRK